MAINLENLDVKTRAYMRGEINLDFEQDKIYYSAYLKDGLKDQWDDFLLNAVN
jgi:hypothetical protein